MIHPNLRYLTATNIIFGGLHMKTNIAWGCAFSPRLCKITCHHSAQLNSQFGPVKYSLQKGQQYWHSQIIIPNPATDRYLQEHSWHSNSYVRETVPTLSLIIRQYLDSLFTALSVQNTLVNYVSLWKETCQATTMSAWSLKVNIYITFWSCSKLARTVLWLANDMNRSQSNW